jgi:mitochondrial import receptor subunit TOM40
LVGNYLSLIAKSSRAQDINLDVVADVHSSHIMAAATLPTPIVTEKPETAIVIPPSDIALPAVRTHGGLFEPALEVYRSLQARRAKLELKNPGTVDQISREVSRDVLLTNQTFSGLRAELNKSFSIFPLFQISHAFSTGSQQLSPYTFLALYGTNNVRCAAPVMVYTYENA